MAHRYNYSFCESHGESTSFNTAAEEQITAGINICGWQDRLHIGCMKGRGWSCPDVAPPAWLLPTGGTGPTGGFGHAVQMTDLSLGSWLSNSPTLCPYPRRHRHPPRTRQPTGGEPKLSQDPHPLGLLLRLFLGWLQSHGLQSRAAARGRPKAALVETPSSPVGPGTRGLVHGCKTQCWSGPTALGINGPWFVQCSGTPCQVETSRGKGIGFAQELDSRLSLPESVTRDLPGAAHSLRSVWIITTALPLPCCVV